ncbi:hypothetical protein HYX58_03170 [Candidatus Dependentiae bacterium]|nr:hypothetical protein [Candidatus Dependentiae bacterium]
MNSLPNDQARNRVRRIATNLNYVAADIDHHVSTLIPETKDRIKSNRNLMVAWSLAGAGSLTLSAITGYLTLKSLFNK